jgi:hypothetical protein
MALLRLILLLSLSTRALAQYPSEKNTQLRRRVQDNSGTIPIPATAHGAFCTAVMGWYDGCTFPGPNDVPGFCDGPTYIPLEEPAFIDLTTCFSNPYFDDSSVSFFGETPDKKNIIEFHMIFATTNNANQYKVVNCLPNGVCECPPALLTLKQQFLAVGACDDTDDYSCLSEAFWGDTDECFVPASLELTDTEIKCSMAAKTQQFGPCDTDLDIPDKAFDAYCTGITGWYDTCEESDPGAEDDMLCSVDTFQSLDDPLFIDLEQCYSNPYHNQHSISFFGKNIDGVVKEFHLIFRSNDPDEFRPFACYTNGACVCPPSIVQLRTQFLAANGCESTDTYSCTSGDFYGDTNRCYVPATIDFGDTDFFCSMLARVEQFLPCDKSQLDGGIPTGSPSNTAAAPLTIAPTTAVTPTTPAGGGGASVGGPPFYLAIESWWTSCTRPSSGINACSKGTKTNPGNGLVYIDLDSCYSNPNMDGHSVSFYTAVNGDLVAFHLLFSTDSMYQQNRPLTCDSNGVCDCSKPTELGDLRGELTRKGECISKPGLTCVTHKSKGFTEECYVPLMEGVSCTTDPNEIYCAMAATVTTLPPPGMDASTPTTPVTAPSPGPVPTVMQPVQTPATPGGTYDMAITGWWDTCTQLSGDHCSTAAKTEPIDGPIYIDFDSCYSNPYLDGRSVSFFIPTVDNDIRAFHLLLVTDDAYANYKPTSCTEGVCDCSPTALTDYRNQVLAKGSCVDIQGLKCATQKTKAFTHECFVPLLEEVDEMDGTDDFYCAMLASVAPVPRGGTTIAPEVPGEAEEPEVPPGLGASSNTAPASPNDNSKTGSILVGVIGTILAIGAFTAIYVVFRKVHKLQRENEAHDGNEEEEEIVWVRKNNFNPKYSTRQDFGEDTEGDGVWKKIDSDAQSLGSHRSGQFTIS